MIKDCLFGQIRAIDDNVYYNTGMDKLSMPTTIPQALKSYVTGQQVITWYNDTNMNPLWAQTPIDNTRHISYGSMLRRAWEIAHVNDITFIKDLIPYTSPEEYHAKILEDHSNDYSLLCASLGFWWHIHMFLNQGDVFDYEYVALRQHDTWYYPELKEHNIEKLLEETTEINRNIPAMYGSRLNTINYPTTAFIQAFFYMFNRAAVRQIRETFFLLILKEIDHYYHLLGKDAQQIYGKSGVILHNVCVKNNINIIDIDVLVDEIYCWIPTARSPDCGNYGRNERNVRNVVSGKACSQ